jgi:hypothetical protein
MAIRKKKTVIYEEFGDVVDAAAPTGASTLSKSADFSKLRSTATSVPSVGQEEQGITETNTDGLNHKTGRTWADALLVFERKDRWDQLVFVGIYILSIFIFSNKITSLAELWLPFVVGTIVNILYFSFPFLSSASLKITQIFKH